MPDINKIDLTNVANSQEGLFKEGMELDSYADGAAVALKDGTVEFIGGYPYQVTGGDLTITPGGTDDNFVYVYLTEDGDDTASVSMSDTAPVWNPTFKGWYNVNDKAIFKFVRQSSSFNQRARLYKGSEFFAEDNISAKALRLFGGNSDTILESFNTDDDFIRQLKINHNNSNVEIENEAGKLSLGAGGVFPMAIENGELTFQEMFTEKSIKATQTYYDSNPSSTVYPAIAALIPNVNDKKVLHGVIDDDIWFCYVERTASNVITFRGMETIGGGTATSFSITDNGGGNYSPVNVLIVTAW